MGTHSTSLHHYWREAEMLRDALKELGNIEKHASAPQRLDELLRCAFPLPFVNASPPLLGRDSRRMCHHPESPEPASCSSGRPLDCIEPLVAACTHLGKKEAMAIPALISVRHDLSAAKARLDSCLRASLR